VLGSTISSRNHGFVTAASAASRESGPGMGGGTCRREGMRNRQFASCLGQTCKAGEDARRRCHRAVTWSLARSSPRRGAPTPTADAPYASIRQPVLHTCQSGRGASAAAHCHVRGARVVRVEAQQHDDAHVEAQQHGDPRAGPISEPPWNRGSVPDFLSRCKIGASIGALPEMKK
jgi:hypothetical protein